MKNNSGKVKAKVAEFKEKGVKLDHNTDHGMTSSIYFFDPDGNRIELCTVSGFGVLV